MFSQLGENGRWNTLYLADAAVIQVPIIQVPYLRLHLTKVHIT